MTKSEFTEILRKTLSGRVSHSVVNENVAYYENYIDTEIRKGRSEEEVLEELGDPRLIAKTIIAASREESASAVGADGDEQERPFTHRIVRIPGWLAALIIFIICFAVFGVIGLILNILLPILIPLVLIYCLILYFRHR